MTVQQMSQESPEFNRFNSTLIIYTLYFKHLQKLKATRTHYSILMRSTVTRQWFISEIRGKLWIHHNVHLERKFNTAPLLNRKIQEKGTRLKA